MKKSLNLDYIKADHIEDLPVADRELIAEAQKATELAYAKYSGFHVGAAVRLQSGKILRAANSESEVFPSGLCAERSLLYFYQSNYYPEPIQTLAIVSDPSPRECYPCGACRQVILETEQRHKRPMRIILFGTRESYLIEDGCDALLPLRFDADFLE